MNDGTGNDKREHKRVKGIDKRMSWLKSYCAFAYLTFEHMRRFVFVHQMLT
jgi:hypothetical protein